MPSLTSRLIPIAGLRPLLPRPPHPFSRHRPMTLAHRPTKTSLSQYLNEIGRIGLMTPAEEIECGRAVKRMTELQTLERPLSQQEQRAIRRGERAKRRFIEANLRLVVHCAKKYTRNTLQFTEMTDLIQEGSIGLMRAVELFDPERGYKFSTYAYWWIRQAMTRALSTTEWQIKRPSTIGELAMRLPKLVQQLSQELGRTPNSEEIAKAAKISLRELQLMYDRGRGLVSLDASITETEGNALIDLIADPATLCSDDNDAALDLEMNEAMLQPVLHQLTEHERRIIELRFGLNGNTPQALNTIGKEMGVSRERIRQVLERVLRKLRFLLNQPLRPDTREDVEPAAVAMAPDLLPRTLPAPLGSLVPEGLPMAARKARWSAPAPRSGALPSAQCSGASSVAA